MFEDFVTVRKPPFFRLSYRPVSSQLENVKRCATQNILCLCFMLAIWLQLVPLISSDLILNLRFEFKRSLGKLHFFPESILSTKGIGKYVGLSALGLVFHAKLQFNNLMHGWLSTWFHFIHHICASFHFRLSWPIVQFTTTSENVVNENQCCQLWL